MFNSKIIIILLFISLNSCQKSKIDIYSTIKIDTNGNMHVKEIFNNYTKDDTLKISRRIDIVSENLLFIGRHSFNERKYFFFKPSKKDTFKFVANLKNNKVNGFDKDYFYHPSYLLRKKHQEKALFEIKFNLPKDHILAYPDKDDLKNPLLVAPAIISGNFKNYSYKNYQVYNLKKNVKKEKTIKEIVDYVDLCFKFYSKIFGEKEKHPKIIFLPLGNTYAGRTINNAIIFNSTYCEDIDKHTIAHETAHLWWGSETLKFKKSIYTEGITDFISFECLKHLGEDNYLKKIKNNKRYRSEGADLSNINSIKSNIFKGRLNYSYNVLPLFFDIYNQENNNSLLNRLALFHKNYKYKSPVTFKELNSFFEKNNFKKFDFKKNPDIFISEKNDSILITSISDLPIKVQIAYKDFKNNTTYDTISFTKNNQTYYKSKNGLKEATIDPFYRIQQFSRSNDVWNLNSNSIFTKSRFYEEISDQSIINITENFIKYLYNKKAANSFIKPNDKKLIKKITKLKTDFKNTIKNTLPNGASIKYFPKTNVVNLKLVFYIKKTNELKLCSYKFKIDKEKIIKINRTNYHN